MRTGLIVAVLAAVLLAGCTGGSLEASPTDGEADVTNDTSDSPDAGGENTIVFTGSGFDPADLTIQQGETVTWVDESSQTMWVASDRHPTHTHYDGTSASEHCPNDGDAFDQCGTGERYRFTFDKTGEWRYHNHNPFVPGGTITVR